MGSLGLTGRREYSENKVISDLLGLIDNGVVVSKKLQHSTQSCHGMLLVTFCS